MSNVLPNAASFQGMIQTLQGFWGDWGCALLPPYDVEVGAGTFHPATVIRALGPRPWNVAFLQPSRRPGDGRYGENPNRVLRHHQFQVILKPSPTDVQDLAIQSFEKLGIDTRVHDIRFVEDDWESPTLGAAGLGWEVWCDGMEVLQFTYFQQVGGIPCDPVCAELTYGLERLALTLQGKESVYDLDWNGAPFPKKLTYGDIYHEMEVELSHYHFEEANIEDLRARFQMAETECAKLVQKRLPLPGYERCMHASHLFNMLDARGGISVMERAQMIARVRHMAHDCFKAWNSLQEDLEKNRRAQGEKS
jgi:glycyl-tRNA synthetase alpha chain